MRYLVTGTNRGIGLELVRQLIERGDQVAAVARDPLAGPALGELAAHAGAQLQLHAADMTDERSVSALGRALEEWTVDVLINNAGVMGQRTSFADLDLADVMYTFDVDALGPLRVARALLPAMRRGTTRKMVHISSTLGSIGDNQSGGAYGYRMAKAALNMASRSLAIELRGEGFISVVVNPGWVQTDMGGGSAPLPVDESVRHLLTLIERLGPEHSGRFFNHTGEELPW